MDDKYRETGDRDAPEAVTTTNRRTDNTTPTVYPDVEFINRTLP